MEQDKTMEQAETERKLKRALNVTGSSPLYPRLPAPIHELGEMGNKAKRRKQRIEDFGEHIEEVAKRALRRVKCTHALKRRHWEAIIGYINSEQDPGCFATYGIGHILQPACHHFLRKQNVLCQACVITTKLLEVLDG